MTARDTCRAFPVTDGTRTRIAALFTQSDRPIVERILVERVGSNLPLVGDDADLVERVRYAVLKLSGGDVQDLERHVGIACVDWRDVLVAAGFGRDPRAHLGWIP